jgi:hypothetical protein
VLQKIRDCIEHVVVLRQVGVVLGHPVRLHRLEQTERMRHLPVSLSRFTVGELPRGLHLEQKRRSPVVPGDVEEPAGIDDLFEIREERARMIEVWLVHAELPPRCSLEEPSVIVAVELDERRRQHLVHPGERRDDGEHLVE